MAAEPNFADHGDSITVVAKYLLFRQQASDPPDPPEGLAVMWMADGTGTGNAGDLLYKVTQGGVTQSGTLAFNV